MYLLATRSDIRSLVDKLELGHENVAVGQLYDILDRLDVVSQMVILLQQSHGNGIRPAV